ncbi:hypothetical protein ES703_96757 [subsurface metagenome]
MIISRLFNTVGLRQTGRYGMVLPNFINQAISGEPITVYGDGLLSLAAPFPANKLKPRTHQ